MIDDSLTDEEHEKVVQIILNGEESELVFIEHKSSEALVSIGSSLLSSSTNFPLTRFSDVNLPGGYESDAADCGDERIFSILNERTNERSE